MEKRSSYETEEPKTNAKSSRKAALFLSAPPPRLPRRLPHADVHLAAAAVGLRVRPRAAAMPPLMQERAFRLARALIDSSPNQRKPNLSLLALALKKEFDGLFGSAWHCVIGRSFGSYLTHSPDGFVYFSLDSGDEEGDLSVLLFQTRLLPVNQPLRRMKKLTSGS